MATTKKTTQPKETIQSLKKQLLNEQKSHVQTRMALESVVMEFHGIKKSFSMIKENYEREKSRLDKTIDILGNVTKK